MTDALTGPLIVLFDFRDPHSYLAMAPTLSLIERTGVLSHWYPFLGTPLKQPGRPGLEDDRGAWHRWHRARYLARDLARYAQARGLPARHFTDGGLYRQDSGELAAMGFNWAFGEGAGVARRYLADVFQGYWDGDLDLDRYSHIERALLLAGADADGFESYAAEEGVHELAAQREAAVADGGFTAFACLLGGEAFVGRQHLPYLEARLSGRRVDA
ncbi:MAG TPA: DsbA family protein [Pseudomonadales bacterium]